MVLHSISLNISHVGDVRNFETMLLLIEIKNVSSLGLLYIEVLKHPSRCLWVPRYTPYECTWACHGLGACLALTDFLAFIAFTTSVGSCQSAPGAIVNYWRWRDLIYIHGVVDGIGPRSRCWLIWLLKKALLLVKDSCLRAGSSLGFPLLGTGPPSVSSFSGILLPLLN